jgi:AcrR family transcriptional regulator
VSSTSDLTARARIRDAAIALFADKGIEGASVRDIAQAAGVSSGLLRHHFGSKAELRDACDEYAMGEVTAIGTQFMETSLLSRIRPETLLWQRYLVRSVLDGSPAGNALFDRVIEYGDQWIKTVGFEVRDPRAFVALISVMKMSMFTMRDQLSRVLGTDVSLPEGWVRVLKASIEIFAHPLVTPEIAEQAHGALDRLVTPEE